MLQLVKCLQLDLVYYYQPPSLLGDWDFCTNQLIDWEDHLQNDQLFVEWDIKFYCR